MADNKQQYIPKVIEAPTKGLNMDISETNHIKDTYPFALNAVIDDNDSHNYILSTERSNKLCDLEFKETHDVNGTPTEVSHSLNNFYQIGRIELDNNATVIFLVTKNTGVTEPYKNAIVLIEEDGENCKLTTIGYGQCLDFDIQHPVSGIYRVRRGCERTIYFTDFKNPIRALNVDNPDYVHVSGGYTQNLDCDLIKLQTDIQYPSLEDAKVIPGGSLVNGSYSFAIQLLDRDFNETKFLVVSKPVNIYYMPDSEDYHLIAGTTDKTVDSTYGYPYAPKKIQIKVRNLDMRYTYYRIAVLLSNTGGDAIDKVYLSTEHPIVSTEDIFELSSLTSGFNPVSINDITVNVNNFSTAESLVTYQNRLLAVNTKGNM